MIANATEAHTSTVSENRTAYTEYKKDYAPAVEAHEQVRELASILNVTDRMLGLTERTFAQHPHLRHAAEIVRNHPDQVREWQASGIRRRYDAHNQPYNENFTDEMAQQEAAKIEAAKHEMLLFLRKNHGNIFTVLERQVMSQDKERDAVAKDVNELIIRLVADINGVKNSLLPQTRDLRNHAVSEVADYLIHASPNFSLLRREIENGDRVNVEDDVLDRFSDIAVANAGQLEIAKASPANRIFAARRWLVDTGRASFEGVPNSTSDKLKPLKIFMTPFYRGLVSRAEFLGRKDNGLGGVIYVGPPGTGKTELAMEVNRMQGYDTRLVQIHHYTTFNELIGEKVIQVGLDRSTSYLERMTKAKQWFTDNKEAGINALEAYYKTAVLDGKERASSFAEFMSRYMLGDNANSPDNAALMEGFIRYLDTQIAGAVLGKETGDQFEDWVNGEVLVAIAQGKRVVLDEIDKAGKYSMGGILTLLAKSPGESVTFGNKTVELPHWFKIDATANRLVKGEEQRQQEGGEVLEYLYDRFNVMEVGYPPVKDMLMINAVRLSDREGNVLLNQGEQWQIIGLTTYLIPLLQSLGATSDDIGPISHRLMKDFCSFVVDPFTRKRTDTPIESALIKSLLENRVVGGASGGMDKVTEIVRRYLPLYQKELQEPCQRVRRKNKPSHSEVLEKGLTEILRSPLLRAIASFDAEQGYMDQEEGVELIDLPQDVDVQELIESLPDPDESQIGFVLVPETHERSGTSITLVGEGANFTDARPYLRTAPIARFKKNDVEVRQVSADAKVAIIQGTDQETQRPIQMMLRMWEENPQDMQPRVINADEEYLISPQNDLVFRRNGNGVVGISTVDQLLSGNSDAPSIVLGPAYRAESMEVSRDGKYLKIASNDGSTYLFSVSRLQKLSLQGKISQVRADMKLGGNRFTFITPDMLIDGEHKQAAIIKPKTELGIW